MILTGENGNGNGETTTEEKPWWTRIIDTTIDAVGNITYVTDDYQVRTADGTLVVDTSSQRSDPVDNGEAPATDNGGPGADAAEFFRRIPMPVWLGVGAILLLGMRR